jgi:hypothetical protein
MGHKKSPILSGSGHSFMLLGVGFIKFIQARAETILSPLPGPFFDPIRGYALGSNGIMEDGLGQSKSAVF